MKEIFKILLYLIPVIGFRITNKHMNKWEVNALKLWNSDLYFIYQLACMLSAIGFSSYGIITLIY